LAEEVGVEPTSHFNSSSTALKAGHTTGCNALPLGIVAKKELKTLEKSNLKSVKFRNIIEDFYLTNPIARSSEVMAELSSITRSKDMKVAAE